MQRPLLLVEDTDSDAEALLRVARKLPLSAPVVRMRDGESALDYLFQRGEYVGALRPVLVLLDLNLPRLDGHEVLRRIRADPRTRLLPVVILTSSVEEGDLARSYGSGCNSYVRKPVSYTEFVEAVRQLGLYWLMLNREPPVERPA